MPISSSLSSFGAVRSSRTTRRSQAAAGSRRWLMGLFLLGVAASGLRPAHAAPGTVTTIVGTGSISSSGDGGPAVAAGIGNPVGLAVDSQGNIYIADSYGSRIRKIDTSGNISTIAGTGTKSFGGDGGPATAAQLNNPVDVVLDSLGNIYIADSSNNRIRKIDTAGNISTIAGTGTPGFSGDGGPATAAQLFFPFGITFDSEGNLLFADRDNQRVRKIDTAGNISTIAGTGTIGSSGDGGPATAAQIYRPCGVVFDSAGNLYFADQGNNRIRKIDTSGTISTFAGTTQGFSGDGGPATAAQLYRPFDITLDSKGNFYIADSFNNRIRKVDPTGAINTIAGTGASGFSGDGGQATLAQFNLTLGSLIDGQGNLLISDYSNNRVRKVEDAAAANTSPTGLSLSPNTVLENQPSGTFVGSLKTTDATQGDTFTYALVAGTGANDNASFSINAAGSVRTTATFNVATKSSYSIRVQTTDAAGASFAQALTITVLEATPPTIAYTTPTANQKLALSAFGAGSISGTATDNVGVASVKVRLSRQRNNANQFWNGSTWVSNTVVVDADVTGTTIATWNLGTKVPPSAQLDAGDYGIRIYALDAAGNKSASLDRYFTLFSDNIAPTVAITSPTSSQVVDINSVSGNTFSGTASDNVGVTSVKLKLGRKRNGAWEYWNGTDFTLASATFDAALNDVGAASVAWQLASAIPASKLDKGSYALYATAYDAAGNKTTSPSRLFGITGNPAAGDAAPSGSANGS